MKKNNFLIFIIVILVILLAVCLVIIYKNNYLGTKTEVLSSGENITSEESLKENTTEVSNVAEENDVVEEITDEERKEIEKYINKICNPIVNCKISEFSDINKANKVWIYSHLCAEDETNYLTKEQIILQLENLFGSNLNLNIENDIELNDDIRMPEKGEVFGVPNKYALPTFGMDNSTYYIIDDIEKKNNEYIVTVIEVNVSTDWETDNEGTILSISAYNENNDLEEVFKISDSELLSTEEKNLLNPSIEEKVLSQKDKFSKFNLIIKNEDNNVYVQEIYKLN